MHLSVYITNYSSVEGQQYNVTWMNLDSALNEFGTLLILHINTTHLMANIG